MRVRTHSRTAGCTGQERCLEIDDRERSVADVRLPEAMRALLRVCNGQTMTHTLAEEFTAGCMGGYVVYDTIVNTRLLSVDVIEGCVEGVRRTLHARCPLLSHKDAMHFVPVASSVRQSRPLLVDCKSGQIMLAGFSLQHLVPATPVSKDRPIMRRSHESIDTTDIDTCAFSSSIAAATSVSSFEPTICISIRRECLCGPLLSQQYCFLV